MLSLTPDEISAYSTLATAIIATFALYQIKVAKNDIKTGVATAQASEAARQCERYIEVFIPKYRVVDNLLIASNYSPSVLSYKEALKANTEDILPQIKEFMGKESESRNLILDALNHLEIMSVSFIKSIASTDVAYESLVFSYCQSVDRLCLFLLSAREDAGTNLLFSNLTALYMEWEPRVSKGLTNYNNNNYRN